MDDYSVFMNNEIKPSEESLRSSLLDVYSHWLQIQDYALEQHPMAQLEWKYSGSKHGWNYRIKDKKRVIVYLLPRKGYFKVAMVFGEKAVETIMQSDVNKCIKDDISSAVKYVEGRGMRISIENESLIPDIFKLIKIKLTN
jgi:hypothetical protein